MKIRRIERFLGRDTNMVVELKVHIPKEVEPQLVESLTSAVDAFKQQTGLKAVKPCGCPDE